jgi:hypothetical protein
MGAKVLDMVGCSEESREAEDARWNTPDEEERIDENQPRKRRKQSVGVKT